MSENDLFEKTGKALKTKDDGEDEMKDTEEKETKNFETIEKELLQYNGRKERKNEETYGEGARTVQVPLGKNPPEFRTHPENSGVFRKTDSGELISPRLVRTKSGIPVSKNSLKKIQKSRKT